MRAPAFRTPWKTQALVDGKDYRFKGVYREVMITLGVIGILDSFVRFALQGMGTPAPVLPTRHLVVTGLYRYVRNPMYVAVVLTILRQGLLFANVTIYGGLVWLLFHRFVLAYENRPSGKVWDLSTNPSAPKSRGGFHASPRGEVIPKRERDRPW